MTQYDPELVEASPWLQGIEMVGVEASQQILGGIDPATAVAIAAAVPVVLRALRMANEATSAMVEDWKAGNAIKRERERLELQREFGRDDKP